MPVSAALEEAWERIDKLHNNAGDGALRGVPTGFRELDNLLSGLQKSDLIILAARPSLGKTTLAMDIARHAAMREKIPTGIFSLEMSVDQITDRLIYAEANVDLWKLRTGRLSSQSEDFQRIRDSLDNLKNAPLYIDDEASINIMQMRAKARRLKAEKGLGLIEMIEELAEEKRLKVDVKSYLKEFEKHQEQSRTARAVIFKSGLADTSEET